MTEHQLRPRASADLDEIWDFERRLRRLPFLVRAACAVAILGACGSSAAVAPKAPPPSLHVDSAGIALVNAAARAAACATRGGPVGVGKARVTYSPSGTVQSVVILTEKFHDTVTASCVRMVFRRARIPPFKGRTPHMFVKSFTIPEGGESHRSRMR